MSFPARHRGRCGRCDQWFAEGTLIDYTDDDEIVHAGECPRETSELPLTRPGGTFVNRTPAVCGVCHLAHAGSCDE